MKKIKFTFSILAFITSVMLLTNCKGNSSAADKTGPEYTSAYVCPMHCKGSGSNEPGKCNVCGMDYVVNPEHEMHQMDSEEMHNQGNTEMTSMIYACPMHPEITGQQGDTCSVCGMNLEMVQTEEHMEHDHSH